MFRDDNTTASAFTTKFKQLKAKIDNYEKIHLDFGYYKELEAYIDDLYAKHILDSVLSDKTFEELRESEMSSLNRLQKLKNSSSYKKSKHKNSNKDEYLE